MTITATAPITLANVMTELRLVTPGRAYPISLGDADVRALAGVASGPISLTNLLGKSSYITLTGVGVNASVLASSQFSGGTATCNPSVTPSGGSGGNTYLWTFTSNPNTCTLSNATSQTCSVSKAYGVGQNGTANAILTCTITDNTAHSTPVTGITAALEWANNA